MFKRLHSISFKIRALSLGSLALASIAFILIFIHDSRENYKKHHEEVSGLVMNYMVTGVGLALAPSIEMVNSAVMYVDGKNMQELEDLFSKMVKSDSSVYDLYYGTAKSRFAGGMFAGGSGWRPYEEPDSKDWDQINRPWFTDAVKFTGEIVITEPYIDSETNRFVFTIAKTAKSSGGTVIGVVAADIFLDVLNSIVESGKITEDGITFLTDDKGLYLTHRDVNKVLKGSVFDDFAKFKDFKAKLFTKKTEVVSNESFYMVASPVSGTNWYLVSTGSRETLDIKSIISILIVIAVSFVMVALISLFFGQAITGGLKRTIRSFGIIGKGDMTHRIEIKGSDEIAHMSERFNGFMDILQAFMQDLNKDVNNLNENTHKLSTISGNLAEVSETTVKKSNSVGNDTELMTNSIRGIANIADNTNVDAGQAQEAAKQMSTHMNTITSAIEKMGVSISEIAENTTEVNNVASSATLKATDATDVMNKLGVAAKEIGQVTDVIKKIADKTNLLALNATIEAASAGEAGKGFAVVAGEIKELANQSAESADDIARRIERIQSDTNNAIAVIHDVSDIIAKINQSVEATAGHVEQQSKVSTEIVNSVEMGRDEAEKVAVSITDITDGTKKVSQNVTQITGGASDITQNIKAISDIACGIQDSAIDIHSSVDEFSHISINLQNKLKQFKV
ncbi:MAG: methyl-accepting chemotaxis protein [Fibromonadaceae bacterium]|jgi:methyl-accepting chemotaxis protein|nr:methyl-accepting chemotaxis protein [Fibromonadaceae bacterium]